jgi:hypothetical protein
MTSTITKIGVYMLFVYVLTKVLNFYGIDISQYGSYLAFYTFIFLSTMVLPNNYYMLNLTPIVKTVVTPPTPVANNPPVQSN